MAEIGILDKKPSLQDEDKSSVSFDLRRGEDASSSPPMETDAEKSHPADQSEDRDDSNADEKATEAEPRSEFDVFWDEPADQDPANPMNWSTSQKWTMMATVSFVTFLT